MNAITYAEDRALSAHLARVDRFADLAELSYTELLSLEDDLSEGECDLTEEEYDQSPPGSQWWMLDDVRAELRGRREDAEEALAKLFVERAKTGGEIPMPSGGRVNYWLAGRYIEETIGSDGFGQMAVSALRGLITTEQLWVAMGAEYATEQSEDLLKAGFVAEVCHG